MEPTTCIGWRIRARAGFTASSCAALGGDGRRATPGSCSPPRETISKSLQLLSRPCRIVQVIPTGYNTVEMTGGRHRGDARALDTKQRPIGHRSGAVVVTGVAPVVVGERATVDAFVFSEQKLVKPGAVPQLDEQLKPFYELGERYHKRVADSRPRARKCGAQSTRCLVWRSTPRASHHEGPRPRGVQRCGRASMPPTRWTLALDYCTSFPGLRGSPCASPKRRMPSQRC